MSELADQVRAAAIEALDNVKWPDGERKIHLARKHRLEVADAVDVALLRELTDHLSSRAYRIVAVKDLYELADEIEGKGR